MCEPNHSIVQYPDRDPDSGNPTEEKIESITPKDGWFKKILGWFHLSRLGSGHSRAIASVRHEAMLPVPFLYEAKWWDRTVHVDGMKARRREVADEALDCATEYSRRVVIGNLSMLRRFLEISLKKSDIPGAYVHQFVHALCVKDKKDDLVKRLRLVCPRWDKSWDSMQNLDGIIKVLLGFTRHRENLCDAWADDDSLWLPDQKRVVTMT